MNINLFEPYRVRRLELKNRFVRSATSDGTADDTGKVTDASVAIYRNLGQGGIGLIVVGMGFVSTTTQHYPGRYGVYSDDMIPGLRRLVQAVHEGRSKIALQLVHCGIETAQSDIPALAVSTIPEITRPHREITEAEIVATVNDFAAAAGRAKQAGFDAVQLHGAHSYLMCQFLSPLRNHRTDQWGGSIENRRRFHLEVIRRVRQVVGPDFPLWIKFGVQDESEEGLTLEEGIETARLMVKEGIDAIEASAGASTRGRAAANPTRKRGEPEVAHFRERAAALKRSVDVPVILVGGIRSLALAQDILDSGDADMIAMCRPFIREPDLIKKWQENSSQEAKCISCNQCRPPQGGGLECRQGDN